MFNGKCMASLKNNPEKICSKKAKENSDFCGCHAKSKKYNKTILDKIRNDDLKKYNIRKKEFDNITSELKFNNIINKLKTDIETNTNYLDSNFSHTLMDIRDGWKDVLISNRIKLADGWWDITILIEHLATQLNQSNMENPYPIYPSSPFTRALYSIDDITKLKNRILKLHIKVNIALKIFLNSNIDELKSFYDEAVDDYNMFSSSLLEHLKASLRYRLINSLNSQGQFMGYWIRKNKTKDEFEKMYDKYNMMSPEIYDYYTGYTIRNFDRDIIYAILISSKPTTWEISNDLTQEYI